MTSGVPQASVLGPIPFLIYINDLLDRTRSKVRLFADNTAIYLAVSNLQDAQILQQDLDQIHEWELQWDMEFNQSKCVVIHVTHAKTPVPSEYLLHGQIRESVGGSKYLGVEISSNLIFNNHIQKICTSANRSLGFIKRNMRTKFPAIREMGYKTTHTLCFIDRYTQVQTTTNTLSNPLQSCNGTRSTGCHPKVHYCPLLNPSRGQYSQSATQCHKC